MKERIKGVFTKKKIFHFLKMALFVVALSLILLSLLGTVAHATGLVDDTINAENLYSKYPLSNYQLDFFVDNSWSWLPWNWLDGIGKSVQYGLYCITNFVWTISLYLSNATGYVVQEAYKLDFINDMADSIGKSIQTLAGVTENGFSSTGFYVGFLLLIILVVGMYVAYTGLIKRETSKALHAVINFVVVFVLSASFIAYAPDYIKKINEFSSDISTASLDLGTKIMLPNSDSEGKDSVDLIRDSLFSIQVEQPWLLLQFGNSNAEEIGTDRVEALVSASPEDEDGKTREEVVKTEIEDNDNNNLTIPQVVNRLGMQNRILNIDHQLLKDSEIGYYIETPKTKNGKRELPLTERAYQAIQRILKNRGKAQPLIVGGYSNFLFLNREGLPKVAGNYEGMVRGLIKKYNKYHTDKLPNITPHSFRHTYCTNMANRGMNPNTLQYLMGHANITMTLGYYAHGTFQSAKAELERLAC